MGFFDSLTELFEAATPWSTVEAEAVQRGGAGSEKTPADKDEGGEGEAEVCSCFSLSAIKIGCFGGLMRCLGIAKRLVKGRVDDYGYGDA